VHRHFDGILQSYAWVSSNVYPGSVEFRNDQEENELLGSLEWEQRSDRTCPHAELIAACAELAGITELEGTEHYCGKVVPDLRRTHNFSSHGPTGYDFLACQAVADNLAHQLNCIRASRPSKEQLAIKDRDLQSRYLQKLQDHTEGLLYYRRFKRYFQGIADDLGVEGPVGRRQILKMAGAMLNSLTSTAAGRSLSGLCFRAACEKAPSKKEQPAIMID
jgi:hypothetical protein